MPNSTTHPADIDVILAVLENPIRRRILKKLSTDTNYPLQLARELNVSQQAIMKHLKVLEDADFVSSVEEPSDKGGPPRKVYVPTKRFSIRIDLGPNTYEENFYAFESYGAHASRGKDEDEDPVPSSSLSVKGLVTGAIVTEAVGILPAYTDPKLENLRIELDSIVIDEDDDRKLARLRSLISALNRELGRIEDRRKNLLELRERAFEETNAMITAYTTDYLEREVYSLFIKEEMDDLETLSDFLHTRSKVIARILDSLRERAI
jgi:DNA-binding transcriptional ArsR family regulator